MYNMVICTIINFISVKEFVKNIFNELETLINMLNIFQNWDFIKRMHGKWSKESKNIYQNVLKNNI